MMQHRGEPLPILTMAGVVRAMKTHRKNYSAGVIAAAEARTAEEERLKEAGRERARARARVRRDLVRIREAIAASPPPADYTLDRPDAHLMPVASSVPSVRSIPSPRGSGVASSSRAGFTHVLIALDELKHKATKGKDLQRFATVRPWVLTHMVHRGLLHVDMHDRYTMTIAGLVLHTIASGTEAWSRPTATVSAWQVVLRRVREGRRRMDEVISKNSATILPRYQRQMTRAGLIRVKDWEVYLTEYGWQWARMDLSVQG